MLLMFHHARSKGVSDLHLLSSTGRHTYLLISIVVGLYLLGKPAEICVTLPVSVRILFCLNIVWFELMYNLSFHLAVIQISNSPSQGGRTPHTFFNMRGYCRSSGVQKLQSTFSNNNFIQTFLKSLTSLIWEQ